MLLESGAPQINSIQTFDIAEGHRLKLDINHSYPKLEELQDTYFGEANITIVQLDGADSKFHTQNALLRTELEKEALALLHSLKHQEWERSRLLMRQNHLRALQNWNTRQKSILSQYDQPPAIRPPKRVGQSILMEAVSRFSNKNEEVVNAFVDNFIELEDIMMRNKHMDDSNNKVQSTIFMPKSIDISKDRVRYRLKIGTIKELHHFCEKPELPRIVKGDSDSTQKFSIEGLVELKHLNPVKNLPVFTSLIPKFEPIPRSCTWINIKFNVHAEDETILRALPYFGDDDFTGVDVSDFEKVPGELEPEIYGEAEELVVSYMLDRHKRPQGTKPEVFSALENVLSISISEISKAYQRIVEGDWYRKTLLNTYPWADRIPHDKVEHKRLRLDDVDGHVPLLQLVGNEIPSLNPDLPENINNGLGVGLGLFNKSHHQDIASNFRDFFCRRCLRYACLLHRIQQPLPRHRIDPKPPFLSKVGKFILPSDLIRDHRRPISALNDSTKGMLFLQQGGDLVEARNDEPKCNFLLSNGTNHGHGANLNSGSKHRSVANRSIDTEALEGAVYYNCFEDRVPRDELNPNNFYFTDFIMIYMSPTTKIDEIFVPSTTLASFPTLLQSIHDGIGGIHSTMEARLDGALMLSGQEESSGSSIDACMNNYGGGNLFLDNVSESRDSWIPSKECKSPEQFQAVKSWVHSYFKSKIPLYNIQKIDKSAPPRVGKNSSFVAPQSSILDTSRPLTDRQKVKEKFDPPLTDVEIGIISHLCHMFAFYRPYKTGDAPNVSEVASPVHSLVDMQSTYINSDPTRNHSTNIQNSNYLVQFVYNILATRSKTEILEVLSEHHVLFPKHQIEEEDGDQFSEQVEGNIEVEDLLLNDDPSTMDDHEDEDLVILSDAASDDDQHEHPMVENIPHNDIMSSYDETSQRGSSTISDGESNRLGSSNNSICTSTTSSSKSSRSRKRKLDLDDCDYESVARKLRGDALDDAQFGTCSTVHDLEELDEIHPVDVPRNLNVLGNIRPTRSKKNDSHESFPVSIEKLKKSDGPPKLPQKIKKNSFKRAFEPCDHDGTCTDCVCVHNGTFCEKYCACSDDCKNKFLGCVCKAGCKAKNCPCFAASRACDPDLCGECGAAVPIELHPFLKRLVNAKSRNMCFSMPKMKRDDLTEASDQSEGIYIRPLCSNVALQHRPQKKLYIGRSQIHGWGAYAGEDIDRNDFITEYTGEVISQEEADRRGNVYDKLNMSYLFTINDDQVVDATRKGNSAKFINHNKETPNCFVRVIQVESDHKIGIFAQRSIRMGEELTFDYNYLTVTAPEWANIKESSKNTSKKSKSRKRRN